MSKGSVVESSFFILMNLNDRGYADRNSRELEKQKKRFKLVLKGLFTKSNWGRWLKIKDPHGSIEDVVSSRTVGAIEVGTVGSDASNHRLHAHLLVKVKHKTRVLINLNYLRNVLRRFAPQTSAHYVRVNASRSEESTREYISKYLDEGNMFVTQAA